MAEPKTTAVSLHAFYTILSARGIERVIREIGFVDLAEHHDQLNRIHGLGLKDRNAALSLHLHGDLQ